MQLTRSDTPPPPPELAAGLAARAADRGQRPAVTVLQPAGRREQGFVTLAQWAAKGAHLLEVDHMVGPGVEVLVDIRAGWPLAAVVCAVWWTGGTVRLAAGDGRPGGIGTAEVAVVHALAPTPDVPDVLLVGDAVDGSPREPSDAPAWAIEVQGFPDHPPTPRAAADLPAVVAPDGTTLTHTEVIGRLTGADATPGTLGYDLATVGAAPLAALLQVAARPLVTGAATVVLDGVERAAAAGDAVRTWYAD